MKNFSIKNGGDLYVYVTSSHKHAIYRDLYYLWDLEIYRLNMISFYG